jgi:hypothetical protein
MKTYWEMEVQIHIFLSSILDGGGQLHASAALPPRKNRREDEDVWEMESCK